MRKARPITTVSAILCALVILAGAALTLYPITGKGVWPALAGSPAMVLTQRNDNSRTGQNLNETTLNTSNVNVSTFGKLFSRSVDGQLYAQPLYVPNLTIPGKGTHNVVFLATTHNTVYAYDADDAAQSTPLWSVNLGPSIPVPDACFGYRYGALHDIQIEVGIISTPVIDINTGTIYVVAATKDGVSTSPNCDATVYHHTLHALDITTGAEKFGGPVRINASVPGTGSGAVGGLITLNNMQELQRPALTLANGKIYMGFGAYADTDSYQGFILAYDAATLAQTNAWTDVPDVATDPTNQPEPYEGGIWQGGSGFTVDSSGNLYINIGNGDFNGNTGGNDFGDTMVKLSPNLSVLDWFTPYNVGNLNRYDTDLGSSGTQLIPGTNYLLGGGKQGVLYLMNTANMGHFNAAGDTQIPQWFQATVGHIHGTPIYWNGPSGPHIYVWGEQDYLKSFAFNGTTFNPTPVSSPNKVPNGMPGGFLSVSANGGTAGSGIIWASHPLNADANVATVSGILEAYDASDVTKQLWTSEQNVARDGVGNFAKFAAPTIANGKVYLGTFSNQLNVYGLLGAQATATVTNTPAPPTSTGTSTPTASATRTSTPTATAVNTAVPSSTPINTAIPSQTPVYTPIPPTSTRTGTPSATATGTASRTSTPAPSASPTGTPAPTLPSPWVDGDIGGPGLAGSAIYSGSTFTVTGGGADIWNAADAFNYVEQPWGGDGQIIARVASQTNSDPWAKTGVMFRESLAAGSTFVDMVITPGNGSAFQYRPTTGAQAIHVAGPVVAAPYWVKLARQGNTFTGSVSADGASWTQVSSITVAMATSIFVGLPDTSHNNAALSTAALDTVSVSTPPAPTSTPVGTTVAPTSTATASATPSTTATATRTSTPAPTATAGGSTLGNGLAGYWLFNETSGVKAADASTNGNTGTVTGGVTWTTGKFANAAQFNGTTGYISAGIVGMPAANAAQSYSWWLKYATVPTTVQNVLSLTNDPSGSAVQLGFRNGSVGAWKYGGTFLVSTPAPTAGAWHFYTYTFDGTTHRLYIDGKQAATGTVAAQTAAPTKLQFGRWTGGSEYLSGALDDVRIYNRVLTTAEITALASQP